jgi:hypothetical protein
MVRWVTVVSLGALCACNFHDGVTPGSIDAPVMLDDAGHEVRTWSFDTGAEFATAAATNHLTIDAPRGSITEAGFVHGSLLMFGHDAAAAFTTADPPEAIVWDKIAPLAPSGVTMWPGVDIVAGDDLRFAGVADPAMFTTWFAGDVYLAPGTHTFQIDADGVGLLEISLDRSFARVATATNSVATGTVTVTDAAWYPMRIGWTNATGPYHLAIRHAVGTGALAPLARDELRAHGSDVSGLLRWVYFRQMYGGGQQGFYGGSPLPQVIQTPFLPLKDLDAAPPLGAPADSDGWSARHVGQIYITMAGTYKFHLHCDDGHQVRMGSGIVDTNGWNAGGGVIDDRTIQANLVEGWNDLILDYNQVGGMASLALDVIDGPDPDLVGHPVPADRLRPVESRADRVTTLTGPAAALPNNSATYTDETLTFNGPVGEVATSADIAIDVSGDQNQMLMRFRTPDNNEVALSGHSTQTGLRYFHQTYSNPLAAAGTWVVRLRDDTPGSNTGAAINGVYVTVHTKSGPDQVAKSATWLSPVLDHGTRLFSVDDIVWTERVPAGGQGAQVFLRTCDTADCSDNPAWGTALAQHAMPVLEARRYMQAKIALTSDGTTETELQSFAVTYKRDL